MQCEKFEALWQAALDERQAPEDQPELQAHAQQCRSCAELLSASESLFDGLDARLFPATPDSLEDRVFAGFNQQPERLGGAWRWGSWLAVAAAALVAVGLVRWATGPAQPAPSRAPEIAQPTPPANQPGNTTAPQTNEAIVADASPLPSMLNSLPGFEDDYLKVMRQTGTAVAFIPQQVERVAQSAEAALVADQLRPVAQPFGAALNALRRTLPGMSAELPTMPDNSKSSHWWGRIELPWA